MLPPQTGGTEVRARKPTPLASTNEPRNPAVANDATVKGSEWRITDRAAIRQAIELNREAGDQRGAGSLPVISGPAGHRAEDYQHEHHSRPDHMYTTTIPKQGPGIPIARPCSRV